MDEIRALFSIVEDQRHQGYVQHKLCDVLIMIMGGVVCGVTELADMMVYIESKQAFYQAHYGIDKFPSKPTLSRILNMVDGDAVGKVIIEIMRRKAGSLSDVIAADGKAIRSSGKKNQAHSFLQILTAYATECGVTLGQEAISHEDKTNEIPMFQSMLDYLEVKGNQDNLHEDVKLFFEDNINDEDMQTYKTLEKNGGRIEKRTCRATDRIKGWLTDLPLWEGLQTVISITRETTAKGVTTEETSYYITSLPCNAKHLLNIARAHWKVESMHWSLDVIWHEDASGLLSENGLKTLNSFRKLALLAHKRYVATLPKKRSVKSNVLSALLNDSVAFDAMACL